MLRSNCIPKLRPLMLLLTTALIVGVGLGTGSPAAAGDLIVFDSISTIQYVGETGGVHYYDLALHSDSYSYREFYFVLDPIKVVHLAEGQVGAHVTFVNADVLSHPEISIYFSDDRRALANINNRRMLNLNMMDSYDPGLADPLPEDTYDITIRLGLSHRISCWEQARVGYWIGDLRGMIIDEALFTESDGMPMPVLHLDLHPTSCPNPFSYRANGAFPAAILGGPDLDVTELDPSSLTLDGLAPLRWSIEDVASPYEGEPCGCTTAGPDGYPDLTLKFDGQLLAAVVGQHPGNTEVELGIHGMFGDGTLVTGSDCVVIRGNPARNEASGEGTGLVTRAVLSAFASGRPGEAVQEIGFHLPEAAEVMIRVYDVAGREVWTPGRTAYAAGDHRVSWTAPASGVFFYRVTAGAGSVAGKHVVQR